MTFEEFDKFTEQLFQEIRTIRDTKGKEYARTEERFDNFNRLAKTTTIDRKVVWQVYFAKHIDAIYSFIQSHRTFSNESIRGRIVDAMAYLSLLAGMIEEESHQSSLGMIAHHQTIMEELELSPVQCRCRRIRNFVDGQVHWEADRSSCPIHCGSQS